MLPTYGMRTIGPLLVGFTIGSLLSFAVFPRLQSIDCPLSNNNMHRLPSQQNFVVDEETADKWQLVVRQPLSAAALDTRSKQRPKLVRPRFVATELGIRDKLFMCVLGAGPLALAINATAAHHVSRLQMFTDSDALPSSSSVFVYQTMGRRGAHVPILDAIVNQTYHSSYDWFFLIAQTTYVNALKLMQLVSHLSIGSAAVVGRPKADGLCDFTAGILLSHKAMQMLIQHRSLCSSIDADSDALAFELCIRLATNLTCSQQIEGKRFTSWQTDGSVVHDRLLQLSHLTAFNNSLTVAPLASEADIYALHRYFVLAEIDNMDRLARTLGETLYNMSIDTPDGPSWPHGLPPFSRPHNRYEVPKWDFYTESDIFKNEPNQNVRKLDGIDRADVTQVVEAGRALVEQREPQLQFARLRAGYRLFDAMRGMNYILDLVYTTPDGAGSTSRRVHLIRPIVATEIVHQVPYVKEDVDLTIVVPVHGVDATMATRRFLARYARNCMSAVGEKRLTRVVIAVPTETISADATEQLSRDLAELRTRCKSSNSQFDLIALAPFDSRLPVAAAALDEAIVHYGEQVMFLVLPPYADVQRELMDRVRINTIRDYQVFFPIPFVEYHPKIVVGGANNKDKVIDAPAPPVPVPNGDGIRAERAVPQPPPPPAPAGNIADKLRLSHSKMSRTQLDVHKDVGHFDTNDFQVASFYGSDYARLRSKLNVDDGAQADLVRLFLDVTDLHIMRTTEPALRLRYHERVCDEALVTDDYERCVLSRREGLASKAQLAHLLYQQQQQHHHHQRQ